MRFPLGPGLASLTLLLQAIAAPTPVTIAATTTTSPSIVVVTQTVTDHVTATDHVTVTDHTTETNIILETAYFADLPPCYASPTGTGAPLVYQPKPSTGSGSGGNDNNNQGSSGSGSSSGSNSSGSVSPSSNSNPNSPSSSSSTPVSGLTTVSNGGSNTGASGTLKTDEGMAGATEHAPVLQPVVHPDHDGTAVEHLMPSNNGSYYYTENGTNDTSIEHLFAQVNTTFVYPAVTIPHTSLVSNVSCIANGTSLAIAFTSNDAYQYAATHWTVGKSGLLLITETLGCSAANDGQHTYWLVDRLTFNNGTMTVVVHVQELAVQDALDNVSLVWGSWTPAGQTPSNGTIILPGTVNANTPGSAAGGNSSAIPGTNGGASSPNSTVPNAATFANLTCANPPASYMGLPTAPCGPDFDQILDDKIGYLDFTVDQDTDVSQANGAWGDFFGTDDAPDSTVARRALARRTLSGALVRREDCAWYDAPCYARKLVKVIVQAPAAIAEKAKDLGTSLVNAAVDVGTGIYNGAKAAYNALSNPSFDTTVPISVGPTNTDSPFGPAYRLYHTEVKKKNGAQGSLDLYCVGCGITGEANIHGALDYSILQLSITKAEIGINGNLKAQVALGMHAEASYEHNYVKNLFSYPIPKAGVKIGNLLVVGVIVSLDATADIKIDAEADILAGVSLTIPNFQANLDMVDRTKSGVSGFEPTFNKEFKATGSVTASLGLGLPVEIGVGLEIPPIPSIGRRVVGLKNTPSVVGTVTAKASVSAGGGVFKRADDDSEGSGDASGSGDAAGSGDAGSTTPDACANSIGFSIDIHDKFELDLLGNLYTLVSFDKTGILSGEKCFGSGVISPPPSTDPAPSTDDSGNSGESPAPAEGSGGDDQASPALATDDQSSPAAPATDASNDNAALSGSDDSSNSDSAPSRRRSFRFARDLDANATSNEESTDSNGANTTTITYAGNNSTSSSQNSTSAAITSQQTNATVADDSTSDGNTTDINTAIGQAIDVADGTTNGTDDFTYGSIVDFSGKYVLGVSDDGNFYIDTIANQAQTIGFAFDSSVAIEDEESDLLFYYPDEMKALGVSRFRATDNEHIPKTADIISLKPINYDDAAATPGVFLAVDSKFNSFATILCNFAGGLDSKIFLASSVADGVAMLKKPELQYVITGGPVTDCAPIAFRSDFAGY